MTAFVQKTTVTTGSGVTSVTSAAFPGSTTAGNQVVVTASLYNGTTGALLTITDSKSNTWRRDASVQQAGAGGFTVATISQSILTTGGASHTVTGTSSIANADIQFVASEYSGQTSTIDKSATNTAGVSTTSLTVTTAATTNANDLLVGVIAPVSSNTADATLSDPPTVNGSATGVNSLGVVRDESTTTGYEGCYKILSATGTQAVAWAYASNTQGGYAAAVVCYQASASATVVQGSTPVPRPGLRLGTPMSRLRGIPAYSAQTNVSDSLTGQAITSSLGTITATVSYAVTGQAITSTEGALTYGVSNSVTGQAITSTEGALTPGLSYSVTGQSLASTEGALNPEIDISVTGQSLTLTEGIITASTGGNVTGTLSGQAITSTLGVITPAITYSVTGQALVATEGIIAAGVGYSVTGLVVTSSEGALSASITYNLSGQLVRLSEGTITATGGTPISTTVWDGGLGLSLMRLGARLS